MPAFLVGSSSSVIRGMSGNRVKVLHGGSDLMDVSSIGAESYNHQ